MFRRQSTIVREREEPAFFERRGLIEVAFDFVLMSANAGGFVPVKFCSANGAVLQSYPSYTFAFPPASASVDPLEAPDLSNAGADGDGLSVGDAIQDLEVHE